MRLPEATVKHLLAGWPIARLATTTEMGAPHQVPVVFHWDGECLWTPVDGKPKSSAALARLRHVERDGRVSVLLDHYDVDWDLLWWIRLDGVATVVRQGEVPSESFVSIGEALRAKYPQYGTVPLFLAEPTLLRVAVRQVRSWCADPTKVPADGKWQ